MRKAKRKSATQKARKSGHPPPSKQPIHDRNPTPEEISNAYSIIKNPAQFILFDHGHVQIRDKKTIAGNQKPIIADITFTDLKTISSQTRLDLDFLLTFLENSKMFVNTVGAEGRSCGGSMWAIGWRKSQ